MNVNDSILSQVFSNPLIFGTIIKFVTAADLTRCAKVCKLWNQICETERKRRKDLQPFFYYYCTDRDEHKCEFKEDTKKCVDAFKEYMTDLYAEPKIVLAFCTTRMIKNAQEFFPISKKRKFEAVAVPKDDHSNDEDRRALNRMCLQNPVIGSLIQYIPLKTEIGFCTSSGIIGTDAGSFKTMEIERCPALAAISIPQMDGVEMHRFKISGFTIGDNDLFSQITGIPDDKPVKCLLVFLYNRIGRNRNLPYQRIIRHYVTTQNWNLALGGAFVTHMFFPRFKARRRNQSYGIAFTGDNVQAASVIWQPYTDNKEDLVKKLLLFQNSELLSGRCFALMFSCVARGSGLYNECDVESNVFRQMFPSIPLIGVFGEGEIGIDYIPKILQKVDADYSWGHTYTTIFVLISIKD